MLKYAKLLVLRSIASNIQSLVDFVVQLDQAFDEFVAKQEALVADCDARIDSVAYAANTAIEKIEEDAQRRIDLINSEREQAQRDAQMAAGLRRSLPTVTGN